MEMELYYIPRQKGEYHSLSKPYAQKVDSMEKVDGHWDPPGLRSPLIWGYDSTRMNAT